MKKALLFFVTMLMSLSIFTQVKGKITDAKKKPLSFVSIYIDKTVTGTTSNDNGEYLLKIPKKGKYTIILF